MSIRTRKVLRVRLLPAPAGLGPPWGMMKNSSLAISPDRVFRRALIWAFLCLGTAAIGRPHPQLRDEGATPMDGIHVIDGSYVIDAGIFQVNITNHGLIGSHYTDFQLYSNAPSAQWPGGSGDEYLYGAGLWIGSKKGGIPAVTTGQPTRELRPTEDILDTIYESERGKVVRPTLAERIAGQRLPNPDADDDHDQRRDEDILNGRDDDGDGRIDEDFAQIGDQMMVATMHDDTRLVQELYPEHSPLGLTVVQRAATWSDEDFDDFVALDFEIRNTGFFDLEDLYLGFYMDCDIQNRGNMANQPDDHAGFFNGVARDSAGIFHRIQVAYMYDGNSNDPLPGYIGVALLDHSTDFSGLRAPAGVGVSAFRILTTGASFVQGGEPLFDSDRYALMTSRRMDRNTRAREADDYKVFVSSGPFRYVKRGAVLNYRLALVIGDGLDMMLRSALHASMVQRGAWFNADLDMETGDQGRETLVCYGDLPPVYGAKPLETYRSIFMDERCIGPDPVFGATPIKYDEDVFKANDGRTCIWVNADNCDECFNYFGVECTVENGLYWQMPRRTFWWEQYSHETGIWGREHREPWVFVGDLPPRPPRLRAIPGDGQVELFWDDLSEHIPDDRTGAFDFESYRVWRIVNWTRPAGVDEHQTPPVNLWSMIGEWDVVNHIPAGVGDNTVDLALGPNTGLTGIRYHPVCLVDRAFAGLEEIMQEVVNADPRGRRLELPSLRLDDGTPRSGLEALLPWENHEAVLDTFFAATGRSGNSAAGILPKRGTRYYHYVDDEVSNNFRAYYAVTARDHTPWWDGWKWVPTGYGAESVPAANFVTTSARQNSQTAGQRSAQGANIYVYPNPVTRESLAEFDMQDTTWDNPTGAQVIWANLPRAHNTIHIYTAAGDLVQTLQHDGTAGDGTAAWNMVSRNQQEISSGIYLYVVRSDDNRFEDFIGRFTVVR
ncbi:MAG: hypothetical protein GY838_03135 [bacterium]|nr:hypothetical protein [bacterium]